MKKEWIFGLIGLVVIGYLIYRAQAGQSAVQQIPEFIPTEAQTTAPQSSGPSEELKLGALQLVGSLAQGREQSALARFNTEAQLKATEIAASVQRATINAQDATARFNTEAQLTATKIAADLQRAGVDADERLGLRQIEAQENIYLTDMGNRRAAEEMTQKAILQAAYDFRKQSLERQGTIFNAIRGNQPYSYVNSFGGERPAPWYTPITQGLGKLIASYGNPVGLAAQGGAQ